MLPVPQVAAAALQTRPSKMFIAGSGPLESGEGAAVEQATNGLVLVAIDDTMS